MRAVLVISAILCMGLLTACRKTSEAVKERTLTVALNSCTNIFSGDNARFCFDSVISDSRCPINALCIWQGAAEARFALTVHGETHVLTLATLSLPGTYRKDTTVAGYKIEFLDLIPYPSLPPVPPSPHEIKATVKVRKL